MRKKTMLNNEEIATFCGQIGMLINAGISPRDGVAILMKDTEDEEGHAILQNLVEKLTTGMKFSEAMEEVGCFPHYVVQMTAIGEEAGQLDDVMNSLAAYYEREENIADSIKSAVTYPFIMIFMMLLVIIVLLTKVLPIFSQVFEQLGTEMSGLSQTLMNLGTAINKGSIGIMIFLIIVLGIILWCRYTKSGQKALRGFLNRFPLTREFYNHVAAGRFASALALTFSSGMDTYSSLDMAGELVDNEAMQKKIEQMKQHLHEDATFAEALTNAGIFSRLYCRMVAVGFKSGNIDSVMAKIADNYENETDRRLHHMLSIVEPTLVIILSLIVGFILLSVILPLMGIMSTIG